MIDEKFYRMLGLPANRPGAMTIPSAAPPSD
jgi:hypothetical protein